MRAWHRELFTKPSLWRLFTRSSKFSDLEKFPLSPMRERIRVKGQ
ncbi:MAG: hypothetical protein NTY64_10910 [Deltaproteobacteria bacterium]|nr:hypothetical protein [Deltaproteobacteria bacterium]